MKQIRKTKRTVERRSDDVTDVSSVDASELKKELDDLLDEIDLVLEVNAFDFVRDFVQKPGE